MSEQDQRYKQKGYYGLPFEALPTELRDRVVVAVEAARSGGRFSINFVEVEGPKGKIPTWKYGDYTDVYILDGATLHKSFHHVGNKQYKMFFTGGGESRYIDEIAAALGFDKSKAEIIPGFGHTEETDAFARQVSPTGPYYGVRTK